MERRSTFVCMALVAAIAVSGMAAALPGSGATGFQTTQPSMLTAVEPESAITPLLTVGDVPRERLSLRGHPGRDLRAHARARDRSIST